MRRLRRLRRERRIIWKLTIFLTCTTTSNRCDERELSEIVDPMIGLRVIVTLDEEGDIPFLVLPPGRIVRKFTGRDGQPYHQVRLDRAIITPSGIGSQNWTLLNLVIAPVL